MIEVQRRVDISFDNVVLVHQQLKSDTNYLYSSLILPCSIIMWTSNVLCSTFSPMFYNKGGRLHGSIDKASNLPPPRALHCIFHITCTRAVHTFQEIQISSQVQIQTHSFQEIQMPSQLQIETDNFQEIQGPSQLQIQTHTFQEIQIPSHVQIQKQKI